MKAISELIDQIPAALWSADMTGSPVDAYIPRWRAVQVANEAETAAYAEGRKDEREVWGPVLDALTGGNVTTPDFLDWLADRLVGVYREPKNIDFVLSLRARAKNIRAAIKAVTGEQA